MHTRLDSVTRIISTNKHTKIQLVFNQPQEHRSTIVTNVITWDNPNQTLQANLNLNLPLI